MSVADARRYLDQIRPSFVTLNGIGEPLLHPDWDEIARHAIEVHSASVSMATTGTLLAENADRLARSGVGLLKVSFHGGRAETFARLASGRSLPQIIEGLKTLNEATRRAGRGPQVRLNYVVTRDNFEELDEALRIAAQCGVGTVYFKGALLLSGPRGMIRADLNDDAVAAAFHRARRTAQKLGIASNLDACVRAAKESPSSDSEKSANATIEPCLVPWTSLFVRVDGTVLSCCNFTWKPGDGELGSLNDEGKLEPLWNGALQAQLRTEMLSGCHSQQACRECPQPLTMSTLMNAGATKLWPGFLSEPARSD